VLRQWTCERGTTSAAAHQCQHTSASSRRRSRSRAPIGRHRPSTLKLCSVQTRRLQVLQMLQLPQMMLGLVVVVAGAEHRSTSTAQSRKSSWWTQ
jgi:hypothetical protein